MDFDIGKMDPKKMKEMMGQFAGMSDEDIGKTMKMMGINMDPKVVREFINKMKGASDDDLNKLKDQYKKGTIKMNAFENPEVVKVEAELKDAKKLFEDNKLAEAEKAAEATIKEIKEFKVDDKEKNKAEIEGELKKILGKAYEQQTLARYTMEDYDTTITKCQAAIADVPVFSIYNRMGICYFKKGRHTKARDAFQKAKELFPKEEDKIAEKYLKLALEEIANY